MFTGCLCVLTDFRAIDAQQKTNNFRRTHALNIQILPVKPKSAKAKLKPNKAKTTTLRENYLKVRT
jgi:hypothetical protein